MAVKKDLKDTKFIADLFDLTERRIQQLSNEKILPVSKQGKNNFYDLIPTTKAFVKYQKDLISGRLEKAKNAGRETERLDAEIRYKNAKSEVAELDLKEIKGEMHRSEDVEELTNNLILTIRSNLSAIPNRCSDELANIEEPIEVAKYLGDEIKQVLIQLSEFEYNPKVYKNKVRERRKKQELLTDDEET